MKNEKKAKDIAQKFIILKKRIEQALEQGTFQKYSKAKQKQLLDRLQSYSTQLRRMLKVSIATIFLVLG